MGQPFLMTLIKLSQINSKLNPSIIIQIKMKVYMEQKFKKKQRKTKYHRPVTQFFASHSRFNQAQQILTSSFLSMTKYSNSYTTHRKINDKKIFRNIRSASLYQSIRPHLNQDKKCKLQIINNNCLKKIYEDSKEKIKEDKEFVYNINQILNKHISSQSKKQNKKHKYHCEKLKINKGKLKIRNRTHTDFGNQQEIKLINFNGQVIGTKLL